jgi:hypothetical protein
VPLTRVLLCGPWVALLRCPLSLLLLRLLSIRGLCCVTRHPWAPLCPLAAFRPGLRLRGPQHLQLHNSPPPFLHQLLLLLLLLLVAAARYLSTFNKGAASCTGPLTCSAAKAVVPSGPLCKWSLLAVPRACRHPEEALLQQEQQEVTCALLHSPWTTKLEGCEPCGPGLW